jgi:hypothetical protein
MLGDVELLQLLGAGLGPPHHHHLLSVPASARDVLRGDSNSSLMAVGDAHLAPLSVIGGMSIDAGLEESSLPMLRLSTLSIPMAPGEVDSPADVMQLAAVTGNFARLSCQEEHMAGSSPPT